MTHIPYGYSIVDGKAVIDEEQAAKVRMIFSDYLSGMSLAAVAAKNGLKMLHSRVGQLLRNRHYHGDAFYPAIIDQETFDAVEEKRMERARCLGRIRELKEPPKPECSNQFYRPKVKKIYEDPFKQAEYAYSLIEREDFINDNS